MIVYGSRMYFKSNLVNSYSECEHCGRYGAMRSYQARKFGHIYFIPLIPMGAHSHVLRECKSCSMGIHIRVDQMESVSNSISEQFKAWVSALANGEKEFVTEPGAEPVSIGLLLSGSLNDLYCLGRIQTIESIIDLLQANDMPMEVELVLARWALIQGRPDVACQHLEAAQKLDPENPILLYQLGHMYLVLGKVPAAEDVYRKFHQLHPADLSLCAELAGVYERSKDWPKMIELYDVLYQTSPELVADAAMKKVYKKACKKSGVSGKFLNQM